MPFNTISIGSVPADEDCAQVGRPDYYGRAVVECRVLVNQLIRVHGEPPAGASFKIKGHPHDFGTYYEVEVKYDEESPLAIAYAFQCEELPENWDDEALKELASAGYPVPGRDTSSRPHTGACDNYQQDPNAHRVCAHCGLPRDQHKF